MGIEHDRTHHFYDDCDPPHVNPESEYDQLVRMVTDYGATKFAEGCAISDATVTLRAEQAAHLLADITVRLHRLYASLGDDV